MLLAAKIWVAPATLSHSPTNSFLSAPVHYPENKARKKSRLFSLAVSSSRGWVGQVARNEGMILNPQGL